MINQLANIAVSVDYEIMQKLDEYLNLSRKLK